MVLCGGGLGTEAMLKVNVEADVGGAMQRVGPHGHGGSVLATAAQTRLEEMDMVTIPDGEMDIVAAGLLPA